MTPELLKANEKAVKKLGEESVLRFLRDIDNMVTFKPSMEYQFIENIVCQYFEVKTAALYNNKNIETKTVNCRRLMSFMLLKHADVKDAAVCFLIQINTRTLRRYKKQIFNIKEFPGSNPELYRAYVHLNKIFSELNK